MSRSCLTFKQLGENVVLELNYVCEIGVDRSQLGSNSDC
jgi:hypothetical protein